MEIMVAKKLEEASFQELIQILTKLQMEDMDAFKALKEIIEDIV
jgi:hypothetical protein